MLRRPRLGGDVSGRWMQAFLVLASALFIFTFASTSHAYSWMIRHGYGKCASCHTDPMGGETLTSFGRVMSDTTLSTRWGEKEPSSKAELLFGVPQPRELRLGGSFRYMDALYQFPRGAAKSRFTTFPMQIDVYGQLTLFDHLRLGGNIGISDVEPGSPYAKPAQVTENNPTDKRALNLIARNFFIGYDISNAFLVRAGRLNLPFGIRMPEHTMWVRDQTRTSREAQQQWGAALDYSAGRWRGELMGIAGNYQVSPDQYRERGYSLYAEYLTGLHSAVGVSSLVTHAEKDINIGKPVTRQAHGLTGRYSPIEEVGILAEMDLLLSDQTTAGYVGMIQGDYEFAQGFHAMLTGELLDAGRLSGTSASANVPGAGEPKVGGWVTFNWFFFTHFDARIDLVVRQQEPVTILSQIHLYL